MPKCVHLQALVGAAIIAASGQALADDAVVPPAEVPGNQAAVATWPLVQVPVHNGIEPYFVKSLGEGVSDAALDRSASAPLLGGIAPEPETGYRFESRVVVRVDDGDALAAVVAALTANQAKLGPAGAPDNPLRGFWLVECGTVAAAIDLATALRKDPAIDEAYLDIQRPYALRSDLPTDPDFGQQWYLHNTLNTLFDANLAPAWKAGFTGAGVTVAIIENGWYNQHPDLAANYNATASQTSTNWQSHGTSVAGIIGMVANNGMGGAGAAYGAGLSKLYIGSAATNAAAFGFRNDLNFVKNNSWGPADNGIARSLTSVEGAAIADAVANGRGGLGTIFVWAGGNGGTGVDRVDYDPYASSRYTIAIGAIDSMDRRSTYSEPGSSLLAVAQSDYNFSPSGGPMIYSSTGTSGYTDAFGGTSASSPLAAGVIALMLEANPDLTWRDVQHVLVRTARHCKPADASWRVNGAGFNVSEQFGFGAVDAGAAVALAQTWESVAPEAVYDTGEIVEGLAIPDNNANGLTRTVVVPQHFRIESVELVLDASHTACGQLRVVVRAPGGLESLLANTRSDNANTYNNGYLFTTMKHFGERAGGTWTLKLSDGVGGTTGTLNDWRLRFYGTPIDCPCDWNDDGAITVPDIFAFLSSWFAGNADFDLNGTNEVVDIFAFLACWFAGPCP
jgi:subtilisin-like proprotein convertase family protein